MTFFTQNDQGQNSFLGTPNFRLLPINNHLQLELLNLTDERTSFYSFLVQIHNCLQAQIFYLIANFVKAKKKGIFFPPQKNMSLDYKSKVKKTKFASGNDHLKQSCILTKKFLYSLTPQKLTISFKRELSSVSHIKVTRIKSFGMDFLC